jgi:CMP-N-acetylneuraminic acid synthetase
MLGEPLREDGFHNTGMMVYAWFVWRKEYYEEPKIRWLDNNPLNYERGNQPNSQNLPNIKALNFGLNLISRENLIRCKNIVGEMPYLKNIDKLEGFDIDTPFDFFLAEKIYEKLMIDSDFLNKY